MKSLASVKFPTEEEIRKRREELSNQWPPINNRRIELWNKRDRLKKDFIQEALEKATAKFHAKWNKSADGKELAKQEEMITAIVQEKQTLQALCPRRNSYKHSSPQGGRVYCDVCGRGWDDRTPAHL